MSNELRQLLNSYLTNVVPEVRGEYAVAHIEAAFFAGAGATMKVITQAGGNTEAVVREIKAHHDKIMGVQ